MDPKNHRCLRLVQKQKELKQSLSFLWMNPHEGMQNVGNVPGTPSLNEVGPETHLILELLLDYRQADEWRCAIPVGPLALQSFLTARECKNWSTAQQSQKYCLSLHNFLSRTPQTEAFFGVILEQQIP